MLFGGNQMKLYSIYGAGQMGLATIDLLRNKGILISDVIDKNASILPPYIEGIPVISPEMFDEEKRISNTIIICVAICSYLDIEKILKSEGFLTIVPCHKFIQDIYSNKVLTNLWSFPEDKVGKIKQWLKVVHDFLYDDYSKSQFDYANFFFNNHYDSPDFNAYAPKEKYYPTEICEVLTENEVILDTFSLDRVYLEKYKAKIGKFNHYYLFGGTENCQENDGITENTIELGGHCGELTIERMGIMRPYTKSGLVKIRVDSIDSQMKGKKFTFLRCYSMSPCKAILEGGIKSIKKNRPVIAVNIGHYLEDFVGIPLLLMTELKAYKWIYRQHGYYGNDSILYGLPEERKIKVAK